jgi:hypothetical protein
MGQPRSFRHAPQSIARFPVFDAGRDGWQQTILLHRETRDQMVKLKNEANLVAEQVEQFAFASDGNASQRNFTTIRLVQSAQQVQQGAFAAAGRAAERDGLALGALEINAAQDGNGVVFVAFPDAFGTQKDGL